MYQPKNHKELVDVVDYFNEQSVERVDKQSCLGMRKFCENIEKHFIGYFEYPNVKLNMKLVTFEWNFEKYKLIFNATSSSNYQLMIEHDIKIWSSILLLNEEAAVKIINVMINNKKFLFGAAS